MTKTNEIHIKATNHINGEGCDATGNVANAVTTTNHFALNKNVHDCSNNNDHHSNTNNDGNAFLFEVNTSQKTTASTLQSLNVVKNDEFDC